MRSHDEGVVDTFFTSRKAGDPPILAKRVELISTPGKNLVPIGLVANVPNQLICRCTEHVMQGDGQLDSAKTGGQVAPRLGDGANHETTKFVSELAELMALELFDTAAGIPRNSRPWFSVLA